MRSKLKHEAPASKIVNDKGVKRAKAWVDRKDENKNDVEAVRKRWEGKAGW